MTARPIEVPTPASSPNRRAGWIAAAVLAMAFGLADVVVALSQVTTPTGVFVSMIFVAPALLYVLVGIRIILRVTGKDPEVPIRQLTGITFVITALYTAVGTLGSLFAWGVSRSSWIHEGGDPAEVPNWPLIAMVVFAALTVLAAVLAKVSSRISDEPGGMT